VQTKGKTNWTKSHARHQPAQKATHQPSRWWAKK